MFGLASLLAVLQLVGMACMPLSPRWLISRGRRDEARAELLKIRDSQVNTINRMKCAGGRTCLYSCHFGPQVCTCQGDSLCICMTFLLKAVRTACTTSNYFVTELRCLP